jgi:hypothetical protein
VRIRASSACGWTRSSANGEGLCPFQPTNPKRRHGVVPRRLLNTEGKSQDFDSVAVDSLTFRQRWSLPSVTALRGSP